jgi:hypothetical protein
LLGIAPNPFAVDDDKRQCPLIGHGHQAASRPRVCIDAISGKFDSCRAENFSAFYVLSNLFF